MGTKKSNRWIFITLIIAVVLAACVGAGYIFARDALNSNKAVAERSFDIYFLNNSKTKPVAEQRKLQIDENTDILRELIDELLKGPLVKDNYRAIPEGTKLLDISKEGTVLTINFSKEYYGPTAADDMIAAVTVVSTLCDVDGVQKVRILVEDEELIGQGKKPLGALGKEDLVLDNQQAACEDTVVTLYFPRVGSDKLISEKRKVKLVDKESVAKSIVSELIKGPEDKDRTRVIPAEVKLLSVEVKGNTCFVNFSKDFIDKHPGGTAGESVTIYSVVNSLTELAEVQKVQFLIEGKKVDAFGHFVFNEPFERNEEFIGE